MRKAWIELTDLAKQPDPGSLEPDRAGEELSHPAAGLEPVEQARSELDPAAPGERPRLPPEVWVLVAAAFVVALGFGLVSPVLPTYASSFGVSNTAVSLVVSAFAFSRLVFAPVAGRMLRRVAERPVYLAGLLIVAASSVGVAYAPGYSGLLIARSLGGLGSTMFTISSLALLVRVTPPGLRGRASAQYASGFLIGSIAGPLVGGSLAAWSIRAPFLIYAVLLGVAALLVRLLLRHVPPPVGTEGQEPADLRSTLRLPAFQAVLASSFANGWAVFGIRMALIPLFVVQILGSSSAVAGYALTAFAIGNAASLTFVGRWIDVHGRRSAVILGLSVSAVVLGLIGTTTQSWQLIVLSAVGGVGSALMGPSQQAVVADVLAGRPGGSVLAVYQMAGDVGTVVGPIIAGLLVDLYGFDLAFWVAGGVVALVVLMWLRAPETLPASHRE